MRIIYLFIQVSRVGEMVAQIYRLRNLCESQKKSFTVVTQEAPEDVIANRAVLDNTFRGVDVVRLPQTNFKAELKKYLKSLEEPYQLYPPYRTDHLRSEFQLYFADKPYVFKGTLSEEERAGGQALRRKFAIPEEARTVTLHVREANYFKEFLKAKSDFSYHDYRNADIDNYLPAIEYLTGRGFFVIRLGDKTMKPLPALPGVVDTPFHPDYEPLVDLYFGATSHFHLGMTSGPASIAMAFEVPVLWTNTILSATVMGQKNDLLLFKTLFSKKLGRPLTYEEIMLSHILNFRNKEDYERANIELLENDPEDIQDATREMLGRLDGSFIHTEDNRIQVHARYVQERTHILRRGMCQEFPFSFSYLSKTKLCTTFYHKHPELLGIPASGEELYKYYIKKDCRG